MIDGGAGIDVIDGRDGDDQIKGSAGDDILYGGSGDDHLHGGQHNDRIEGGAGDDVLRGGSGDANQLFGGDGSDVYLFDDPNSQNDVTEHERSGGTDTLDFSEMTLPARSVLRVDLTSKRIASTDVLRISTPNPFLFEDVVGTNGDDEITDNLASNQLTGGKGNDRYYLTSLAENVDGIDALRLPPQERAALLQLLASSAGPTFAFVQTDHLIEVGGLEGGNADEVVMSQVRGDAKVLMDPSGGPNPPLFIAHTGTVREQRIDPVNQVAYARQVPESGASFENFHGGLGNDEIAGNDADNILIGGPGTNIISGGDGNDTIWVEDGAGEFSGGSGGDTYYFAPSLQSLTTLSEERADIRKGLLLKKLPDTADFSQWSGPLYFFLSDVQPAGAPPVTLKGAESFENVVGTNHGTNIISGNTADNLLIGGTGVDILVGLLGDDILVGQAGIDRLVGGMGRDLLIGGLGGDQLLGSENEDILVGGTTDYDDNDVALNEILSEWTSGRSLATRIANLRSGVGPTGLTRLQQGPGGTVHEDNAADTLSGEAGSDWFFAALGSQDLLPDFGMEDTRN